MGFWQSREDPSSVSGGWKEGSAWDEQGKRRKHGILTAFGEVEVEEEKNFVIIASLI